MAVEEEDTKFIFEAYPQRVFIATMYLIVFVVGVFGNSLTILAVIFSRKLQSVTNVFVINLAVADFLTCLVLPWNIVTMLSGSNEPDGVHWSCAVAGAVLLLCIAASFYNLASIALSRWVLITHMSLFMKIYKPAVVIVWIVLIWVLSFSFTILPAILGLGAFGYNPKYKTCSDISAEYLPGINSTQNFDTIQAVGVFPIPLLVILFCYVNIILYVRRHAQNLNQWRGVENPTSGGTKVTEMSASTSDTAEDGRNAMPIAPLEGRPASTINTLRNRIHSNVSDQEIRVTKNLFIVFCAFILCLLPYTVCLVVDESDPFIPYASAILFFNSCINPIIYATRFPNFKTIFGMVLRCRWDQIPEPSGVLVRLRGPK